MIRRLYYGLLLITRLHVPQRNVAACLTAVIRFIGMRCDAFLQMI